MNNFNKSNYIVAALIRKKNLKKKSFIIDLVLAKKSKHGKLFVIEKLGSVDYLNSKININFFRLIFWMQFYPAINPKAWKILTAFIIGRQW